jgi:hypothetical protein
MGRMGRMGRMSQDLGIRSRVQPKYKTVLRFMTFWI